MKSPPLKIVLPAALVLAGAAFILFTRDSSVQVRAARAVEGQVIPVVYATGSIRPDRETTVAAETSGRVVSLLVDEGDQVRAGMLIARLDDTAARLRVREAEQQRLTALARLEQAAGPTDPMSLRTLESQVAAAQARAQAARERVTGLQDRSRVAERNAEMVESQIESARARARSAEQAVRASQREVDAARQQALAAEAEVEQARSTQAAAQDLYRRRLELLGERAIAQRMVIEAKTAVETAGAALRSAERRLDAAREGIGAAEANASASSERASEAKAAVLTAQRSAEAARAQVEQDDQAVAEQRRQVQAMEADLAALRSQLAQARRGPLQRDIAAPRSEMRSREDAVAQARDALLRYSVRAPVDGRITSRRVEVGDLAQPGRALFVIASEQLLYVRADVDEADIESIRPGSPARFQVDALPDQVFSGAVAFIGPSADEEGRTYPVEIRRIHPAAPLRIGLTADVNIQGPPVRSAVLAPTAVLVTGEDETFVWVAAGSRVERRRVRIRAQDLNRVQITEGVKAGELLVLDPPAGLTEQSRVKATEVTIDLKTGRASAAAQ